MTLYRPLTELLKSGAAEARAAFPEACSGGEGDQEQGEEEEDLASVQEVRVAVLQLRVGEDAVEEEECGGGVDEVVETPPEGAADAFLQERGDQHEEDEVEGDGTGEVQLRLQEGVDGPQDLDQREVGRLQQEEHRWMGEGKDDRGIGGPAVEQEEVDLPVGPEAERAVAQGDQHAEQEVDGDGTDRAKAQVGAEIQQGQWREPFFWNGGLSR